MMGEHPLPPLLMHHVRGGALSIVLLLLVIS